MDIVLKDIRKSYGERVVFGGYSAVFPGGRASAVMAPSGGGKTTLLRLIMGLEAPDSGSVTGVPEKIAAVFQEERLCPGLSAVKNIQMAVGRTAARRRVEPLLSRLGLSGSLDVPVSSLSGGMQRRVSLARALLAEAELLVLDEPFKGLDGENRALAAAAVREFSAGRTVLLVTHDAAEAGLIGAERIFTLPAVPSGGAAPAT